jgi:hypothetical protein
MCLISSVVKNEKDMLETVDGIEYAIFILTAFRGSQSPHKDRIASNAARQLDSSLTSSMVIEKSFGGCITK